MKETPTIQKEFRKLNVKLPPPQKENSVFWWLAGIALAVSFLALTLHYYVAHKKATSISVSK